MAKIKEQCVYLINFGDCIKVGRTENIKRRIEQIQCQSGRDMIEYTIFKTKNSHKAETYILNKYSKKRKEWIYGHNYTNVIKELNRDKLFNKILISKSSIISREERAKWGTRNTIKLISTWSSKNNTKELLAEFYNSIKSLQITKYEEAFELLKNKDMEDVAELFPCLASDEYNIDELIGLNAMLFTVPCVMLGIPEDELAFEMFKGTDMSVKKFIYSKYSQPRIEA